MKAFALGCGWCVAGWCVAGLHHLCSHDTHVFSSTAVRFCNSLVLSLPEIERYQHFKVLVCLKRPMSRRQPTLASLFSQGSQQRQQQRAEPDVPDNPSSTNEVIEIDHNSDAEQDDDDGEPAVVGKRRPKRKFNLSWQRDRPWLVKRRQHGDDTCYCLACDTYLRLKKSALTDHEKTALHKDQVQTFQQQTRLPDVLAVNVHKLDKVSSSNW
jgi:hypothetical protein